MTARLPRSLPLGRSPTLATDRLKLHALRDDDAERIAALANDWDIARRMTRFPYPYGIEDARFYLREVAPHEVAWGITSADDGSLFGVAGLVPHDPDNAIELGYWLGRPAWGSGIATEAAEAIVRFAFAELDLPALTSGCFVDNVPSYRVLTKLGFAEVGRSERACLAEGRALPFIDMTLEAGTRRPA